MTNNYDIPEVVEMGRAQDLILGNAKLTPIVLDSPGQDFRTPDMSDDE